MVLSEKLLKIWHGCDYNPDQWLHDPQILKDDIKYMKETKCNVMSVGIFSWSVLEPQEGVFNFEWLDGVINSLYENGIYTILATPSGARPAWMAQKYPEVLRMDYTGIRREFGERHNHCYTSPIYREKVRIINTKLAERYANHPGVIMWHISNEYNTGECFCPTCRAAFTKWLKDKYQTIENLNSLWWNGFWSHNYTDFSQIAPPHPLGEIRSNGLYVDWYRFRSDILINFFDEEIKPLKAANSNLPVTANLMDFFEVDYNKFAKHMDVVSWDNYPYWHRGDDQTPSAIERAYFHSRFNSMKGDRPFMMMESSPSSTNWQDVAKLRRPGMQILSSLQAVAHGSDTVQYFQWRKNRGQAEQFHGAVMGHDNTNKTRVFNDVKKTGELLDSISEIIGSHTKNEVAFLTDYDNIWMLDYTQGYRNIDQYKGYLRCLYKNYGALWYQNIGADFIGSDEDFSQYKIVVAPMLFMTKRGFKERIEKFVENGGTFITTYISGMVDEYNLCWQGDGFYPLGDVLGIQFEETDSLLDSDENNVEMFGSTYKCRNYCELSHLNGAQALGTYKKDFYAGMPAVTVNSFGKGKAYYIATEFDDDGYRKIYSEIVKDSVLENKGIETPYGVNIQMRYHDDGTAYAFIMNFTDEKKWLSLPFDYEILSGELSDGNIGGYGICVLKLK